MRVRGRNALKKKHEDGSRRRDVRRIVAIMPCIRLMLERDVDAVAGDMFLISKKAIFYSSLRSSSNRPKHLSSFTFDCPLKLQSLSNQNIHV